MLWRLKKKKEGFPGKEDPRKGVASAVKKRRAGETSVWRRGKRPKENGRRKIIPKGGGGEMEKKLKGSRRVNAKGREKQRRNRPKEGDGTA